MPDTAPLSVQLPTDLVGRVRGTVAGLRRLGYDATLVAAVAESLVTWCDEQEDHYNNGERFPPTVRLPAGRRLSSASTEAPPGAIAEAESTIPQRKAPS